MENYLKIIKRLDVCQDKFWENVRDTNGTLERLVKYLKRDHGICCIYKCYTPASRLKNSVSEDWLCENHWKETQEESV